QSKGDRVWWYCCGVPVTRLTGALLENLPIYWLTKKWHLDGVCSFAAMWEDLPGSPAPFRYDHGMQHRIVFLPDGNILDTPRRELEREGLRDLEVIEVIEDRIDARRGDDSSAARRLRQALDAILESIVPYKYGYSQTPEAWEKARA